MSNPTVTVSFAAPDPGAGIVDLADLVALLNTLVTGQIQGSYVPYVIGSSTPAVDDQDKAWHKTDDAGRPLGTFLFYNGSWRREYTGYPKQVSMFTGDPAKYFDATGLGLPNLEWDGWAIMNGQNGTTNLSNVFLVGGRMDNAGFSGYTTSAVSTDSQIPSGAGWQTNTGGFIAPSLAAGAGVYFLTNNNLPSMKVQLSGKGDYDVTQSKAQSQAIVTGRWSGPGFQTIDVATFGADPAGSPPVTQVPIPTLPPFYALAYVTFVGYS